VGGDSAADALSAAGDGYDFHGDRIQGCPGKINAIPSAAGQLLCQDGTEAATANHLVAKRAVFGRQQRFLEA
jgi:hypothetical protein